ncbi:MAG TPA: hypothetical protein VMT17_10610 [Anaeromyxobacteraceae bacterium]|nr:hypothetical protein [Anaeromyxobacteraceae bacterium]
MRFEVLADIAILFLVGALASGGFIYAFGRSRRRPFVEERARPRT